MWHPRWLLTLPLALAATLGTASASSIRDGAKMFSADAVQKAEAVLDHVERQDRVPVIIETIPTLNGEEIADLSLERAERAGSRGVYVLIAKKEHKLYDRVSHHLSGAINPARQRAIREAFLSGLKQGEPDAALLQGARTIASEVASAHAEVGRVGQRAPGPLRGRGGMPARRPGGFGLSSLLGIGLLVVGVLFFIRLLGSLFGGGRAMGGQPGRFGGGYGPGYGGGGGGGFMSSLFGGIGGAMAGNWLYDQFSGRHQGGYTDSSSYGGDPGAAPPDDWAGGTGGGSDWGGGEAGGGGGGDWGGGGGGGGGDWGGGGGDFGGGGGDW